MSPLVQRYLRTAITFLLIGLGLGAWMLIRRELAGEYPVPRLVSAHTHVILVGFVMMMILGVALWMFPRPDRDDVRYRPALAQAAYWLLTVSTATFAFLGAILAANGLPSLRQIVWITLAMVGAGSTAMAFNRIADREYDALNPRTATRALPAGLLSVGFVWAFTVVSAVLFFVAAAMLNRLALVLAPVALASIVFYSYSKRWTLLSHVFWVGVFDSADRSMDRGSRSDR